MKSTPDLTGALDGEIEAYFDLLSVERDERLKRRPLLAYEAEVRQRAVLDLCCLSEDAAVIDVGCGNARDLVPLSERRRLAVGLDRSQSMLVSAHRTLAKTGYRAVLVRGDASRLPFAGQHFDVVVSSEVLEHLPNWHGAIREMARVLKPGGRLVLTTPNRCGVYGWWKRVADTTPQLVRQWFGQEPHPYDSWKTAKELTSAVEAAGLQVCARLGVCYYLLPYFVGYLLPQPLARVTVALTRPLEARWRSSHPEGGYLVALAATKPVG